MDATSPTDQSAPDAPGPDPVDATLDMETPLDTGPSLPDVGPSVDAGADLDSNGGDLGSVSHDAGPPGEDSGVEDPTPDGDLPRPDQGQPGPPEFARAGDPRSTRQAGSPDSGERFVESCPEGQVFVGIQGQLHHHRSHLGRLGVFCAWMGVVDGRIVIDDRRPGPLRGLVGDGEEFRALCPRHKAVVEYAGFANFLVDRLTLYCARPVLEDGALIWEDSEAILSIGGRGGEAVPRGSCNRDEIAVGANINAGDGVDAFGLICQRIVQQD